MKSNVRHMVLSQFPDNTAFRDQHCQYLQIHVHIIPNETH